MNWPPGLLVVCGFLSLLQCFSQSKALFLFLFSFFSSLSSILLSFYRLFPIVLPSPAKYLPWVDSSGTSSSVPMRCESPRRSEQVENGTNGSKAGVEGRLRSASPVRNNDAPKVAGVC